MSANRRGLAARWAVAGRRPSGIVLVNPEFFSDDWEDGTNDAWVTVTGNLTVNAGDARSGTNGLNVAPDGVTAAHIATSTTKWDQDHPWASLSVYFRINSQTPGDSTELVTIRNTTNLQNLDLFVASGGDFEVDLENALGSQNLGTPVEDVWYHYQARVFFADTTYTARVLLTNTNAGTSESASWSNDNQTSAFVRSLHLGTTTSTKVYDVSFDDLTMTIADNDPGWVS